VLPDSNISGAKAKSWRPLQSKTSFYRTRISLFRALIPNIEFDVALKINGSLAYGGRKTDGTCTPPQCSLGSTLSKDLIMDKDRIKGSANQAKGSIKQAAGKATGDTKLKAEGAMDKAKGKVQSAVGGAKDALRNKR
jgi:uncharacterized protein YjbJ (UPF0337 family)